MNLRYVWICVATVLLLIQNGVVLWQQPSVPEGGSRWATGGIVGGALGVSMLILLSLRPLNRLPAAGIIALMVGPACMVTAWQCDCPRGFMVETMLTAFILVQFLLERYDTVFLIKARRFLQPLDSWVNETGDPDETYLRAMVSQAVEQRRNRHRYETGIGTLPPAAEVFLELRAAVAEWYEVVARPALDRELDDKIDELAARGELVRREPVELPATPTEEQQIDIMRMPRRRMTREQREERRRLKALKKLEQDAIRVEPTQRKLDRRKPES